jgi:hypothetical protein
MNRRTIILKDLILGALMDAGGQAYLTYQAIHNPSAFMSLVSKVIPLQVKLGTSDDRTATRKIVHVHVPDLPRLAQPQDVVIDVDQSQTPSELLTK